MQEEYLAFHTFSDETAAGDFAEDLVTAGIPYTITRVAASLDRNFFGASSEKIIAVKIPAAAFNQANTALDAYYQKLVGAVGPDYYLFGFSNEELFEILAKPDEWGHFDRQLAQKILSDRGQPIDSQQLSRLKEQRISELARPEKTSWSLIGFGYVLIFLGILFLSPVIHVGFMYTPWGFISCLFTGTLLAYYKKILPDGTKAYYFNAFSRKNGKIIIVAAGIVLIIAIIQWYFFIRPD